MGLKKVNEVVNHWRQKEWMAPMRNIDICNFVGVVIRAFAEPDPELGELGAVEFKKGDLVEIIGAHVSCVLLRSGNPIEALVEIGKQRLWVPLFQLRKVKPFEDTAELEGQDGKV